MPIKFEGIDLVPADGYILNFIVNGEDDKVFCDGIEELMSRVLTQDEWANWLTGKGLPLLNGKKINDEVEFAKEYINKTVDDYCALFED